MSQIIKYNAFTNLFVLYRGGYDTDNKRGIDPYNRGVDKGFLLHIKNEEKEKAFKIFNIPNDKQDHVVEVNLSICFDEHMRIVVYNNKTVRNTGRLYKEYKTNSMTVKKWGDPYHYYMPEEYPIKIKYWDLKGDDYLICQMTSLFHLYNIIPEILDKYPQITDTNTRNSEECKELCNFLYMLNPIDLNSSWDYTEEQKYINEFGEKLFKQRIKEHIEKCEKQSQLDGYCDRCGAPEALYIENPYDAEIYGESNHEWLCETCYNELQNDI